MSELQDQLLQCESQLRAEIERLISIAQAGVAKSDFDCNRADVLEARVDELEAEVATTSDLEEQLAVLRAEIQLMNADREYSSED
jgi:hypothetical protein